LYEQSGIQLNGDDPGSDQQLVLSLVQLLTGRQIECEPSRIAFLDTETTGLEPSQGHRIIEIGCVELLARKLTGNNRHFYLNPDRDSHEDALKVHGISNEFLRDNAGTTPYLEALFLMWVRLAKRLRQAKIAHGDLQHGNVLLVPGANPSKLGLKLIDYDGMWVPALAKSPSGEVGHANYQHPLRATQAAYGPDSDRFTHLVVGCALRALVVDQHRDHIMAIFGDLAGLARETSVHPRFVFAHVVSPHAPPVLGKDGAGRDGWACFPATCSFWVTGEPEGHEAENQPDLLARHCTEAGLIEKAAALWDKAGHRSL
jgi:hypothetical protein